MSVAYHVVYHIWAASTSPNDESRMQSPLVLIPVAPPRGSLVVDLVEPSDCSGSDSSPGFDSGFDRPPQTIGVKDLLVLFQVHRNLRCRSDSTQSKRCFLTPRSRFLQPSAISSHNFSSSVSHQRQKLRHHDHLRLHTAYHPE